jgi:hypothetical protein
MKKSLIFLFSIACVAVSGQDIRKGYKSLEKSEYDKAKDAFEKTIANNPEDIGANLGLALVYSDDKSTFFNLVEGWKYIERIQGKPLDLSQEDIEVLTEYFLNTEVRKTSRPVKKKIEIAIEAIEARYIKYIREENNLEVVYQTLEKYPNFRHYDNVIHIRNQFEFRKYEKQNTIEGYEEFINKFPDAAQVDKAKRFRNQLAFESAKVLNTPEAYSKYISQYPESDNLQAAIKLRNASAFTVAKKINTLESYENYILEYPDALEVSEAKILQQGILYEKAKRVQSLQAYNDFILKYPEGQYFVDIFNLKATELGAQFLTETHFNMPGILWAKGFDNNGKLESGGSVITSSNGDCILACNTRANDTSYSDAWIIKLDATGKMLWNKIIGQTFEDEVVSVLLDSKDNVIVFGYTYLSEDSASRMGWMFKLGSDGRKIWNKNLGKIMMNAFTIDQNDRIFIGGGIERDSLGSQYSIAIFNTDAKKIGERTYTGRGAINDLWQIADGNLFICGSNWITLMDQKRYIHWDANIPEALTSTHCAITSEGEFYIAGANDAAIFYAKYASNGNKLWLQQFDKSDSSQFISDLAAVTQDNLLVFEQKTGEAKLKLFTKEGNFMGSKEILGNTQLECITSSENGTVFLMNNGDLILIRLSQVTSL